MLMSENACSQEGLDPEFEILGWADAESKPLDFNLTPAQATKKALKISGVNIG